MSNREKIQKALQNKCLSVPIIKAVLGIKFFLFSFSVQILSSSSFSLNVTPTNLSFLRWLLKKLWEAVHDFVPLLFTNVYFPLILRKNRSSLFWWLLFLIPELGAGKFHSLDWSGGYNSSPSVLSLSLSLWGHRKWGHFISLSYKCFICKGWYGARCF